MVDEMKLPRIGVAGLTHLGLITATAGAARGFNVMGFQNDPALVAQLEACTPHIVEPDLRELMVEHKDRLTFSSNSSDLGECDIVYIAVDVPTDDYGRSDLTPIERTIEEVTVKLNADALLVVLCQVPPGFTRKLPLPRHRLYYQVETLVFGQAIDRALRPERFIVGCADPSSELDQRLQVFLDAFECPILRMRYESAELAKISINMYLVASVSVTNTLAELCEHVSADWSEVAPSLRLDRRIGEFAYLKPGLGIAGGNLERDLATVIRLAADHKTDAGVIVAEVANSRHRKDWAWQALKSHGLEQDAAATIAILGLAYKENTHSTKNSPALALLARLRGRKVRVFDPVVPAAAAGIDLVAADSELAAAEGADAVCIMTPWPQFKTIDPKALKSRMRGRVLIDPFRMLDGAAAMAAGLSYATLGVAPTSRS